MHNILKIMKSSLKGHETNVSVGAGGTVGALAHLTKQQKQRIEAEARPLVRIFAVRLTYS